MSKQPFRHIRALNDKTLVDALSNHTGVLQGVVGWIRAHERWQRVWCAWAGTLTLAVSWLVYREVVQWLAGR